MPVRRNESGTWFYRKQVKLPDGSRERIFGTPTRNTKAAAEVAEREHVERVVEEFRNPKGRREVPKFAEWFNGRYWEEWVVGRKNKPATIEGKRMAFRIHLEPFFGKMRLNEIKVGEIAQFRAQLIRKGLEEKSINNILAVLSKPLHYAFDVELLDRAPTGTSASAG